jgi:hypothetical protein
MVLRDIEIEAAGGTGWSSKRLVFGKDITQLYGPNGCGKTPIIQSIAFVLGYPVKYREDIYKNCEAVVLRLDDRDREIELRRRIDKKLDIQARVNGGELTTFYDEKDYSSFLFRLLGIKTTTLTSTGNEPVTPYLSTFLPLFYLDQDVGYTSLYAAPSNFIKSQYTEMMRLCFGLHPKHSFDQKKFEIEKKKRLDHLDRTIVRQQQLLDNLAKELGDSKLSSVELERQITAIREQIDSLKDGRNLADNAVSALNKHIRNRHNIYQNIEGEIKELRVRVNGFFRIKDEIEIEINTLSLNEEARHLFGSFEDICANPSCGLFLGSAESYGKNLLYLRDQVKDLQRNTTIQESRIVQLEVQRDAILSEIKDLEKIRQEALAEQGIDAVIDTITALTSRVVALQKEKQVVDAIEDEQKAYILFLNERESIQNDLASSGSANSSDLRALEIRKKLRERIVHWLDTLHTRNVSRDVHVDSDFWVKFAEEKVAQFTGSTLLRVILAVRTAAFEIYTEDKNNRFRFLILDTPRQQDIEAVDLASYVAALKELAVDNDAQIIFSTTEYHYDCAAGDAEWAPEFPGLEQNMFLGTAENR